MTRWYEHHLRKAAKCECLGMLRVAIRHLDKAKTHTSDEDELFQLNVWRTRLTQEAAKAAEGKR